MVGRVVSKVVGRVVGRVTGGMVGRVVEVKKVVSELGGEWVNDKRVADV